MVINDEVKNQYQFCVLKCCEGRYTDMYIDDLDGSGYSHVYDKEYGKPYAMSTIHDTLKRVIKRSKCQYEPIPINLKDIKWKDWNWVEWKRVFVKINTKLRNHYRKKYITILEGFDKIVNKNNIEIDFKINKGIIRTDYNTYKTRAKSKDDLAKLESELVKLEFYIQDLINDLKVQYVKLEEKEGK